MTGIEIIIVAGCLTGCSYSSYKQGEARGVEIGGAVSMSLMEEFLKDKLGKDEADRILRTGLRFHNWLRRSLNEK
jgi:hypothetical protein